MEVIVVGLEKLEGGKFPYFVGLSIEEWGKDSNFIFFVPEGYCNTDPPLIPIIFVGFDEDGIGRLQIMFLSDFLIAIENIGSMFERLSFGKLLQMLEIHRINIFSFLDFVNHIIFC